MKKRMIQCICAMLFILVLILDSRTAIKGAQDGISLCIQSVIPSLFPFLVFSGMLTSATLGTKSPILRPIGKLLRIPNGTECIYLAGILGGYPTGAQAVYTAWQQGQLDKRNAQRMLSFCSNAGPSFIFGILGSAFPEFWMSWLLWVVHILSSVLVAVSQPPVEYENKSLITQSPLTFTQSLKRSVITMSYICGWIVLFRCILAFGDRWILWLCPAPVRIGIYGFLELANGCCNLAQIEHLGLRFIICSILLSFGGICIFMQTASVTGKLGIRQYAQGKILQTFYSLLLSWLVQWILFPSGFKVQFSPVLLPFLLLGFAYWLLQRRKSKNRGRILQVYGV